MNKKLLIGLLASLMTFSFAAACGTTDTPNNSDTGSSNVSTDTPATGKYTVTLRDGNPMFGGSVEELEVEAGATLELPAKTAEGKTFKGWFTLDENGEPTVAAPAVMPEEAITLYAVWEVTPYTLTIKQEGAEDKVFTFGIEYDFANGIDISVADLAYVLEDNLPAGTEDAAYTFAEEIPAEFALQNYVFTVSEVAPVQLILAGDRYDDTTYEYVYVAAGAKLDLPFLYAEGKIFNGWVYYEEVYNEEYDWYDEVEREAPAVMPEDGLLLVAKWEIVPYTINVTLPTGEVVTVKIGADYDWEAGVTAYYETESVLFELEAALKAYATDTVVYVVEDLPEEFALQNYEFTATEAERVYTVYMPDYSEVQYKYGDAIELPTPDAIEGAEFVKWVYYYEGEAFDVPATASAVIDQANFEQVWNVTPYTLTLKNVILEYVWNEETQKDDPVFGDMTITFGAMADWQNGIYSTINELAFTVELWLPESNEDYNYAWDKEIPEEFGLQNYEFTVVESKTEFTYTFVINPMDRMNGRVVVTTGWGEALTAPEMVAEGKTFLGWTDVEGNSVEVPATMPKENVVVYPSWDVQKYTITIVNGDVSEEFIFAVEYADGVMLSVADLPYFLADQLPKSEGTTSYTWAEEVPETFALQNYTFTVVKSNSLSIPDATALGAGMTHNTYTSEFYYITGTVINVASTMFGNMTIADAEGNTLYVYGCYDETGATRYDAMTTKPQVGDTVKFYSVVGQFNGEAQLKNARTITITKPETVADVHKVLVEAYTLAPESRITEAGDVTLPVVGATYADVAIAYTSSNTEIAVVNGGTITFTLPVEATNITLTATLTLNDKTITKEFIVAVDAAPAAGEKTVAVNFSTISGAQYADETHVINSDLTVSTHGKGCHFNTQLRIYDSSSNNGWAMLSLSGAASLLSLNMGYKKANLEVYGSTDGATWELIGTIATTSTSYYDYSLSIDATKGYTYLKLDASGAQLRIASLEVKFIAG